MDEMTLTLNNPLTEEEWDLIEDVDFDKTNSIEFHTKHGKTVKFVKCTDERTEDMISRQTAIAEFSCCELTPDGGIDANYAIDFLKQLPSAQPELIRCKECIYWEQESICDGYCSEIEKGGFDEDHFCSYAERRADG